MRMDKEFYLTKVLPNISNDKIILTGDSACVFAGLSVSGNYVPDVFTSKECLKNVRLEGFVNYCYVPVVDYENFCIKSNFCSKVLIPTKERALVENIKYNLEFIDEGSFCDSMERYIHSKDYDRDKLEEVANFFGVPMKEVDYWIEESSDYNSY